MGAIPPSGPQNTSGHSGGPARGRGASINPVNRFESLSLHVLSDDAEQITSEDEEPGLPRVVTSVYTDRSRTILNRVDSPDLRMEWTVNPYRGCEHGCVYCYARPGHEYLGLSSGLDFEAKIVAKRDADSLLRAELERPAWKGESIALSGVTDPYQPVEAKLRITRAVLEICVEYRQPVFIVTKSRLVLRDLDLLKQLSVHRAVGVAISLTTLDPGLSRIMEPRAASPASRLAAMKTLADAGIPVQVMTAPVIPGVNDAELPALLGAAKEAGATGAGYVLLRLPHQNKAIFEAWLQQHFPDRAQRVLSLLRQCHDGQLYRAEYKTRQRGSGPVAQAIGDTFRVFAIRHGLWRARKDTRSTGLEARTSGSPFRRPGAAHQPGLFDA